MPRRRSRSLFGSFEDALPAILERIEAGEKARDVYEQVAPTIGTTPSALKRRVVRARHRLDEGDGVLDHRRVLSVEQEQALLGLIKAFATANDPLNVEELVPAAQALAGIDYFDGDCWRDRFLARHNKLVVVRNNKCITAARTSPNILTDVDHYLASVELLRETHPVAARGVMSLDEFLLAFHGSRTGARKLEWRRRRRKASKVPRTKRLGSICYVTSATGTVIAKFVILARRKEGEFVPQLHRVRRRDCPNVFFASSKSGVMDNYLFGLVADKLIELKATGRDGLGADLDRRLHFDGLDAHKQLPVVLKLQQARIFPVLLPPNTTHFSAVEDNLFFGVLRATTNEWVRLRSSVDNSAERVATVIWEALDKAEARANMPNVIRASYANVGTEPWAPDRIRELAQRAVGKVLPHSSLEPPLVHPAAVAAQAVLESRQPAPTARVRRVSGLSHDAFRTLEELDADHAAKEALKETVKADKEAAAKAKAEEKEKKAAARAAALEMRAAERLERVAKRKRQDEEKEERKRARIEQQAERRATKAASKCRICGSVWREQASASWLGCEGCESFWVCDQHEFGLNVVRIHEADVHGLRDASII